MSRLLLAFLSAILLVALSHPLPAQAQPAGEDLSGFAAEVLGHFNRSMGKMERLAAVIPADVYAWAPMEGTMRLSAVLMHIARYNYLYLDTSLGIPAPAGLVMADMEAVTDKQEILKALAASAAHVRQHLEAMTSAQLHETAPLYGRTVPAWAVLMQLVSHMNEHVGQVVSYARMNQVVPPWSQ